jgi:hypothetical protein
MSRWPVVEVTWKQLRTAAAMFGAVGIAGMVLLVVAFVYANQRSHEMMDACTATPPGFPEYLTRARVTVDVGSIGSDFECVYELRNGQIIRRPPP